jgi:hypothetical protein
MSLRILKLENGKRTIEVGGEIVGALTPPAGYRVIYSLSTLGTIIFILIPDEVALGVASRIIGPAEREGDL